MKANLLSLSLLAGVLATGLHAQNITFGGVGNPIWVDDQTSYDIVADGLTFTLSLDLFGGSNDLNATAAGDVFGHQGGDSNSRIDNDADAVALDDESVTFSLSVSDPSQLSDLSMSVLNLSQLRASNSDVISLDDNVIDTPISYTVVGTNPPLRYGNGELLDGLTPLSLGGLSTWELTVTATGGDGFTVEDIRFDYSLVPEPGTYALLAGSVALGFVMLRRRD